MKNTVVLNNLISTLSLDELKSVSQKILQMLNSVNGVSFAAYENTLTCRKCKDEHIVKFGKDKNGKQRYRCRQCGTSFTATSNSTISQTHHSAETWERYIELLLSKASLAKCAKECNITVKTAFLWRHKILNAIQKDQDNRALGGVIEIDELYIPISYKGNHSKSNKFSMPRPAHKRGTDCRTQIGSRACVMFAYERNGQTYAEVLGKGQPTIQMLSHAFDNRILSDSVVISDKAVSTKNYFAKKDDIQLIQLLAHIKPKSMNSPPEIRGAMHIQNINNLHARFRRFVYNYNGVSTKYLNHYLNLFIWLENHKKAQDFDYNESLIKQLSQADTYIPTKTIYSYPAIPEVA